MKFPSISDVAAYSDQELAQFLGFPEQIAAMKDELAELNSLKGKAREEADRMWAERMAPSVSPQSIKWIKEDAIRSTKPGKGLNEETDPEDIF